MGEASIIAALPRLSCAGARAVLRAALDLALPRLCAVCASRSRAKAFARPAGRSSPSSRAPIASGCVFRSPTIPVPAFSPWRRSPIRPLTSAPRVAVHFDEIVCALVHTLKYGDQLDLASTMGRRSLAQAGGELLADADALVTVPLHWRRHWAAALQPIGFAGGGRCQGERPADRPARSNG